MSRIMLDLRHITVADILCVTTIEEATEVYRQTWCKAPSNGQEPWKGYIPPIGTWRCDPMLEEWDVLIEVHAHEIEPAEKDWDHALRHWSTQNYIQWLLAGHESPPINVVRNITVCKLLSADGRRRVLAARETDLPIMKAWFSETDDRGRALWRGDNYAVQASE